MADTSINYAVAIDPPGTQDRDDAIWITRHGDTFEITIAVANVAHFVQPGAPLDKHARARGNTIYQAGSVSRSMLPRSMTQRLSLGATRNMPVLAVFAVLLPDGAVTSRIGEATLEQTLPLDYEQVSAILAGQEPPNTSGNLAVMLRDAWRLAQLLLQRRRLRGALAVYEPQTGLGSTEEGQLVQLTAQQQQVGHFIVQELMILANEQIAAWAAAQRLLIINRNHHASAVAPPRERLLADMLAAVEHPDSFDLQTLEQRRRLVLERAFYAPYVSGHYGLNLPCYTHATSPLRRYADLRTQQVLLAQLRGEVPLDPEETGLIAARLTALAREQSEQKSQWLKQQAQQESRRLGLSTRLVGLSADEFHKALKIQLREDQLNENMRDEAIRRFDAGLAQPRDAFVILFVGLAPTALQAAAANWLGQAPEHAVSVLSMLVQHEQLAPVIFDEPPARPAQSNMFRVSASLMRDGSIIRGAERLATNKKSARAQAALSLMYKLGNRPDASADEVCAAAQTIETVAPPASLPSSAVQPVAALHEWAQQRHWPQPEFTITVGGAAHEPQYDCQCLLITSAGSLHGAGSGSTKAAARAQAAQSLIAQVYAALD